jgi:hypothetical protein
MLKMLLLACYTINLFFHPEDRDSIFLRNVGETLPDYTSSDPKWFARQEECRRVVLVWTDVSTVFWDVAPCSSCVKLLVAYVYYSSTLKMKAVCHSETDSYTCQYSDRLRARWPQNRGRFPAGSREFSFLHSVQTGSGAHPASYPMGTRLILKREKR